MFIYFLNRLLRRKLFYTAVIFPSVISALYFVFNVLPAQNLNRETVYSMWIESFSASELQSIFFLLIPLFAAMAMSDVYITDKATGYLDIILNRDSGCKSYFKILFYMNFIASGLCVLIPLIINLYLCLLVCPDRKPDIVIDGTNIINYYGTDTLLPQLYYEHPHIHVLIYLLLGFLVGGIFGSVALASSFFVKNRFLVWVDPLVCNYFYMLLINMLIKDGYRFSLTFICMQQAGQSELVGTIFTLCAWIALCVTVYTIGVKKRVSI